MTRMGTRFIHLLQEKRYVTHAHTHTHSDNNKISNMQQLSSNFYFFFCSQVSTRLGRVNLLQVEKVRMKFLSFSVCPVVNTNVHYFFMHPNHNFNILFILAVEIFSFLGNCPVWTSDTSVASDKKYYSHGDDHVEWPVVPRCFNPEHIVGV